MRKTSLMTKLKNHVAALRLEVNAMLDEEPLVAAGICAAIGGLIGLMVGVAAS